MLIRPLLVAGPLFGIAALGGLAGCQTWGPSWTEVSGSRYANYTDYNRFPTAINLIDSDNPGPRHGYGHGYTYYKVDPGRHTLELSALNGTPNWVPGINRENFVMELEPCKRYYINAEFDNRLLTPWKPVIDYVEPIPGCGSGAAAQY